jgi:hypothetical protein
MDQSEALGHFAAWAKQTISLAISIRDDQSRRQLDNVETIKLAGSEAHHLTDELWEQARSECGSNATFNETMLTYACKVFEWCHKHMNP